MDLKSIFRIVPDFPKPGIQFVDITTLANHAKALQWTIDALAEPYLNQKIDKVVAVESRGFIFGAPLAIKLGAGLSLVRKPNKLPAETFSHSYELEYGKDAVEIHKDAILPGENVLIIDDLLATGGTVGAVKNLLGNFDCRIAGISFVVELPFFHAREKFAPIPVYSLTTFDFE